ncbi:PEP-CTERM sorting domain-containing protein [Duganella sp. FT80W]|uniref:PEP-CTERM sorting domain-containing protein n=1 Tax=Duganella guangzhouensis TaxID=2666084 RepID=A0A6I2KWR1_9BURK|nr:PEP-CTERM sorting domain-containing protein [Duganella guangzhouensis]MRW89992.1 PEP-CTERM sorting domain-containing protein [Duganella guangzhouensis]
MKAIKLLQTIAIATLLASGAAQAATTVELLNNGSFEANTQAANSWHIYNSLTGWSAGTYGVELRNNVAGTAADGVNFVELDTTANSSITQSVNTVLGKTYTLTFEYENRSGVSISSQGLQVLWGGTVVGSVNNAANWTTVTYTLIGNGSTEALTFKAIGTSDSYGTSLDKVSLTTAVPEPETYAMLLAGLGLMGFIARRRRK